MLELLTSETPNGWKISTLLEELGCEYKVTPIALSKQEQKQDWYLKLNPNGRIPTLIDHGNDDFVLFESGAIMIYLAEKFGRFMPRDDKGRSLVIQWLMFQMSAIGPMMGQANVFLRYFPEKLPSVIDRYQREVKRLFEVLNNRLADHEYLAGDYSIADIAHFCWVRGHDWAGVPLDAYPHIQRWLALIAARPAVQRGLAIPPPTDLGAKDEKTIEGGKKILV